MSGSIRQHKAVPGEPALTVRNPHTSPSDVFRRNMREIRKRRRWRQADLAQRLDWDRSVISLIENGRREISLDEAIAICATLGVSPLNLVVSTIPSRSPPTRSSMDSRSASGCAATPWGPTR